VGVVGEVWVVVVVSSAGLVRVDEVEEDVLPLEG